MQVVSENAEKSMCECGCEMFKRPMFILSNYEVASITDTDSDVFENCNTYSEYVGKWRCFNCGRVASVEIQKALNERYNSPFDIILDY